MQDDHSTLEPQVPRYQTVFSFILLQNTKYLVHSFQMKTHCCQNCYITAAANFTPLMQHRIKGQKILVDCQPCFFCPVTSEGGKGKERLTLVVIHQTYEILINSALTSEH